MKKTMTLFSIIIFTSIILISCRGKSNDSNEPNSEKVQSDKPDINDGSKIDDDPQGTNEKNDKMKNCEEQFPDIEKWTLIVDEESLSNFGSFPKSGYKNQKGDIVIPLDRYRCLSDTFEYFGLIQDIQENYNMFGIDKTGKKLFEAVPDGEGYAILENEGRILIQENGKYGFANHKGEIIIKPKYSCAESFYQGKARVSYECRKSKDEHIMWESNHWIYIDKCGNEVISNK